MPKDPGDLSLATPTIAGKGGRFASGSRKWWIILLTSFAILTGAACWWRSTPAPPRWVDIRKGDGSILSIATGRDPDGNEIVVAGGYCRTDDTGRDLRVVCYDASNGHVRWETQDSRALPNMMIHPILAIDSSGDVLVGWETAAVLLGENKLVSKYSGRTGKVLWDWKVERIVTGSSMTAVPVPDRNGGLWVSAIQATPGEYRRSIAALDPKTGAVLWQQDLNRARDGFDRPANIHHLRDGGAMLVIPPRSGEKRFPWLIQHRSITGGLNWNYEILRDNDRAFPSVTSCVDESNGQMILSWITSFGTPGHPEIAALDLTTGKERWFAIDPLSGDPNSAGMDTLALDRDGTPTLWGRYVKETTRTKWWLWSWQNGIPLPMRQSETIEHPLRISVSTIDGSLVKRERLARGNEIITEKLTKPGFEEVSAVILRSMRGRDKTSDQSQQESWRAVQIDSNSPFDYFSRQPGGNVACRAFPEHAALTPSGRLVIAGDPAEEKRE